MKLRYFICTETYHINGNMGFCYSGQMLEVFGSMFKQFGYIKSHIRTYKQLDLTKWREIRTQADILPHEYDSLSSQQFLKYIPII